MSLALQRWLYVATVALLACGLFLATSCTTVTRSVEEPLHIEGAEFVGNQACMDCHATIHQKFPANPHARVKIRTAKGSLDTSCEACHGPGSRHVAAGGQGLDKFILNPKKTSEACFRCHQNVHAEFRLPHHHPVLEGHLNCVQCHDPHGHDMMKPASGLGLARVNQSCAQCHQEQSRKFVFEHEAMREGCTACHNPHGTVHPKLLVQHDSNLCLKCHAQTQTAPGNLFIGKVNHTAFVRQGGCWTAGCHAAVHGSNINPKLQY